jgi:hypothetical protein
VETNRGYVLAELESAARTLGVDTIRDLRALTIRTDDALIRSISTTSKASALAWKALSKTRTSWTVFPIRNIADSLDKGL